MPVVKIPVKTTNLDCKILNSRFEVGRLVYNACLGEANKRLRKYWKHKDFLMARKIMQSPRWQLLSKQHKLSKEEKLEHKVPFDLLENAKKEVGYYLRDAKQYGKNYGLESFVATIRDDRIGWFTDHLDATSCLTLAKRAFNAVEKRRKNRKIKIRFLKSHQDYIYTIDGKNNSPLKWENEQVYWGNWIGRSGRTPLVILSPLINIAEDIKYSIIKNSPECVNYISLSRQIVNGKWKYWAIINFDGDPIIKHALGTGRIGLDIGPQTYAFVADSLAKLSVFCKELEFNEKQIKKLQRQISRQLRLNNPNNFECDFKDKKDKWKKGKVKTGKNNWIVSTRQEKLEIKKAEIQRKQAEHRRCLHGQLINELRKLGDDVRFEKISYKAWQKIFGKSIGKRAVGMFISLLKHKFDYTKGSATEINTQKAKLSQRCPNCPRVVKKGKTTSENLKNRVHDCECGYLMQRDLTSALLARSTDVDGCIDASIAKFECKDKEPVLQAALCNLNESSSSEHLQTYFDLSKSELERIACKGEVKISDNHG